MAATSTGYVRYMGHVRNDDDDAITVTLNLDVNTVAFARNGAMVPKLTVSIDHEAYYFAFSALASMAYYTYTFAKQDYSARGGDASKVHDPKDGPEIIKVNFFLGI